MLTYNCIGLIRIKHIRYHLCMIFMILIALFRTTNTIAFPVSAFIGITLVMIIICNKQELIAYACCLFAMLGIMQNQMALLIVSVGVLVRIKKIDLKAFIPVTLMIIWELLHSGQTNNNVYGFLQDFSSLITISVVLSDRDYDYDYGFIFRSFAYTTVICSFINLLACSSLYGYSIVSLERFGNLSGDYNDFQGLINPNTNSFICLMALSSLLLLKYNNSENKSDKYILIILDVIILLTQSKAAILCAVITYLLYFYYSNAYKSFSSTKMMRFFGAVVILAIGVYIFYDTIEAIIKRITNGDITTGRNVINRFYYDHLANNANNFLYGIGLHNYTLHIKDIYGESIWQNYIGLATMAGDKIVYKPCHLAILEIVVVWGLPGLLLILSLLLVIIKRGNKQDQPNHIRFISLAVVAIYCLQSGFIASGTMISSLIIAALCITYSPGQYTNRSIIHMTTSKEPMVFAL